MDAKELKNYLRVFLESIPPEQYEQAKIKEREKRARVLGYLIQQKEAAISDDVAKECGVTRSEAFRYMSELYKLGLLDYGWLITYDDKTIPPKEFHHIAGPSLTEEEIENRGREYLLLPKSS